MTRTPWPFLRVPSRIWGRTTGRLTRPFKVRLVLLICRVLLMSLRIKGQNLYTKGDEASLALMDKQIYRLVGKATTLAASVIPRDHSFRMLLCLYIHSNM
jgi:hypothetical protein